MERKPPTRSRPHTPAPGLPAQAQADYRFHFVLIFEDEGSLMSPTSIKIYLILYKLGGSIIDDADSSGQDAAE